MDAPYYDKTNKKVIGKFKCETKGIPIVEFVGLRPKMYSYLYQNTPTPTSKVLEKHRVKGIASSASRALQHYDYKEQLLLMKTISLIGASDRNCTRSMRSPVRNEASAHSTIKISSG